MVFAYVECYLFGGNEMLAAFYIREWSLHIVYNDYQAICGSQEDRLRRRLE